VADFSMAMPRLPQAKNTRLMLYIGSSIGNFDPEHAQQLLESMRLSLRRGDALLLGTDMRKDEATLVAAYDDSLGVTAKFNKNLLARINRELGADFNLAKFRHVALWNSEESRIEIYLESEAEQTVSIPALKRQFTFARRERVHTENSYKYTQSGVRTMLAKAGFSHQKSWTDDRKWYSVHLARAV
jgi:dimethylhistidine N-methyltransferase